MAHRATLTGKILSDELFNLHYFHYTPTPPFLTQEDFLREMQLLKDFIARKTANPKSETVYTVPPHVGQNIRVPVGSKVTFYSPEEL